MMDGNVVDKYVIFWAAKRRIRRFWQRLTRAPDPFLCEIR